ncbi:tetratricopeptide repeat-containing sensor histidine kinase [Ekhidna sp.]
MKIFALYLMGCFLILDLIAQDTRIDSLRNLLEVAEQDSSKIQLLLDLAKEHSVLDTALASKFYNDAIIISKELGNIAYINVAREKGDYLRKTRRKQLAIGFLLRVLKEISNKEIPELEILYTGIGIAHYQSYQPDSAAYYFRKGILLAKKYHKTEREGILWMNIGNTNYMKGLLDSALFYYAKSQEVLSKTTSYHRIAELHITKTIIYQNLKDYSKAERELNSALKLKMPNQEELIKHRSQVFERKSTLHFLKNEYQLALVTIDSALQLYEVIKEREEIMKSLRFKSTVLLRQGKVSAAQDILWQLFDYQEGNTDLYERASVLKDIGFSFTISGNHREAIKLFRQALKFTGSSEIKRVHTNILNDLGSTYLATSQYDSAKWFLDQAIQETKEDEIIPETYHYLAKYHIMVGQPDSALLYANYLMGNQKVKEIPSLYFGAKFIQASANYSRGNLKRAQGIINEIIRQEREINSLTIIRDSYELLYHIKYDQGRFRDAISAIEKYQILNDSVINLDNLTQGIRLQYESTYDRQQLKDSLQYAEKDQLALLEQQKNKILVSNQRITIILIGSSTLLLLAISLILFRNNRSSQKKNKLIGEQKESIEKSLNEKEILLKEIHHRVKNNLQVISSLLNLQAENLSTESALEALTDGQNRVKSMSLIHQRLYQENDLRGVDVNDYLKNLIPQLISSFALNNKEIDYKIDVGDIKLDVDTLVPLGLIINELVTNSLKHAFEEMNSGIIELKIREENDMLHVSIKDNGKGFNEAELQNSNSFGWKMIDSLSRKLKAELSILNEEGTLVDIFISRYKMVI